MRCPHRETYGEYADRIGSWHKKFLFFPTRVDRKNTRWFQFVWRRATSYYGNRGDARSTIEYEYLPYSNNKPIDDKMLVNVTVVLTKENFNILWDFYRFKQKPNIKVV